MNNSDERDYDEERANAALIREGGDSGAGALVAVRTLEQVHQERITLRVSQHSRTPCPGPPLHSCTDRTHPIAVDVFAADAGGPAVVIPLRAGADYVSVGVVS